jgi:hypothetical protein
VSRHFHIRSDTVLGYSEAVNTTDCIISAIDEYQRCVLAAQSVMALCVYNEYLRYPLCIPQPRRVFWRTTDVHRLPACYARSAVICDRQAIAFQSGVFVVA